MKFMQPYSNFVRAEDQKTIPKEERKLFCHDFNSKIEKSVVLEFFCFLFIRFKFTDKIHE